MELKKVQGDHIPEVIEYLGMNEWAVRWDIEEINSEDIHGYAYYELKFNEEPTYDSFVSKVIRTKYSADEEAALKSNMVEPKSKIINRYVLVDTAPRAIISGINKSFLIIFIVFIVYFE